VPGESRGTRGMSACKTNRQSCEPSRARRSRSTLFRHRATAGQVKSRRGSHGSRPQQFVKPQG
jgi:hypothetical protein